MISAYFDTLSFFFQKAIGHEVFTHHIGQHLLGIRSHRDIPSVASHHAFPAIIGSALRPKLRETIPMAHPSEVFGHLHPQFPWAQGHPATCQNLLHLHGMDYPDLLYHHDYRSTLAEGHSPPVGHQYNLAYPLLQDPKIKKKEYFCTFFIKFFRKYFQN